MSISAACYTNAAIVAKELSSKGIYLDVPPTSVLGELLDSSVSFESPKTTELPIVMAGAGATGMNYAPLMSTRAQDVEYLTKNYEELSMHSKRIADLVNDIAPLVTSHVSFARNTVRPMVLEFAGKLEKYAIAAKPLDPTSDFEIIEGAVPALLLDESFASELVNYHGISAQHPTSSICVVFPETEEGLVALTSMPNDRLNGLMNEWLAGLPAGFMKNVFKANFTSQPLGEEAKSYGSYYLFGSGDVYNRLNVALACYIIASRLSMDPQKTEASLSLMDYKRIMREYINYAGAEVMKGFANVRRHIEGNTMVSQVSTAAKKIYVHKTLYRAWLEAGGRPEILLGMIVSGQVQFGVAAIDENRERLLSAWNTYVGLVQADIRAETKRRFKEYVMWEMANSMAELTPTEVEYVNENGEVLRAKVLENAEKEVEHLSHRLMDDFYHTALHLVAKARFYYTSSYEILNEMVEAAKARAASGAAADEELDAREAALMSALNYIAMYQASMIKVVQ